MSTVPFENLRAVSAEAAISSRMYIAVPPVSRPRRFLGRLQSERKIVYPGIFISASRWFTVAVVLDGLQVVLP